MDLYQFKSAVCSEPPTDLLDRFFSHITQLCKSNAQLHPRNTCTKKAVGQLAPDVSRTAYEKDPGFHFGDRYLNLRINVLQENESEFSALNSDVARQQ